MRIVTCGIIHLARKIFWKTNISYPWYAFVHVRIMRQESITFSENFAYVLNEWSIFDTSVFAGFGALWKLFLPWKSYKNFFFCLVLSCRNIILNSKTISKTHMRLFWKCKIFPTTNRHLPPHFRDVSKSCEACKVEFFAEIANGF